MATTRNRIGIISILDGWNAEVDINDYRIAEDGSLVIEYWVSGPTSTAKIAPRWIAEWFGGRFVEWVYDVNGNPDGMVIEKEV